MYPKSKSPLELKYERYRGMWRIWGAGGAIYGAMCWYIVYSSMAGSGAVPIYHVLAVYLYSDIIYHILSRQ